MRTTFREAFTEQFFRNTVLSRPPPQRIYLHGTVSHQVLVRKPMTPFAMILQATLPPVDKNMLRSVSEYVRRHVYVFPRSIVHKNSPRHWVYIGEPNRTIRKRGRPSIRVPSSSPSEVPNLAIEKEHYTCGIMSNNIQNTCGIMLLIEGDMTKRCVLRNRAIKMLVLDDSDEMLKKDFKEQIYDIYKYVPLATQIILVSATLPHEIFEMTSKFMTDLIRIPCKTIFIYFPQFSIGIIKPSIISNLMYSRFQ